MSGRTTTPVARSGGSYAIGYVSGDRPTEGATGGRRLVVRLVVCPDCGQAVAEDDLNDCGDHTLIEEVER